ncbi:hypothetical protein Xen7305DRAFT_00024360 [Xenococcus sp. PCC 7305]|uniref:hypothetical protein n=1 Tax=Xenococcus sp. PCC 7305 TaxID=102125 RepID=UPI0002ABA735|nr:hypothetical protein [Xenococcus sp. PCC 7305]ELS02718.1 hypothetical protein Xen7305DRAFT_00024360 [Xenococcus sp. PCC 7305]
MINGRNPEITIKFTEKPELPEQGKKVQLEIKSDNGIIIKTEVNRKSLKKQVTKMESFADWVGALSGKIVSVSPEGVIEIEGAGVNVFEKKPKAPAPAKEASPETSTAA